MFQLETVPTGVRPTTSTDPTAPIATSVEEFARDRVRYERLVRVRYARVLTAEDAEDIVADALIDDAARCPATTPQGARAWFSRVVLNRAEDYRRARDGRPRSERRSADPSGITPPQATSRAAYGRTVSLGALDEDRLTALSTRRSHGEDAQLQGVLRREHAAKIIGVALAALPAEDRRLLRARFLAADGPHSRAEVAGQLGVSLTQYEVRFTRAWRALREAITDVAPTATCHHVQAGTLDAETVEIHLAICVPCRLRRQLGLVG